MGNTKKLLYVVIALVLVSCSVSGGGSTGPQITIAEIYEISLTVNDEGEVHLSGEVAIPTPLRSKFVDLDWLLAFDLTFNEANQTENTLFLMYEDDFGNIIQDTYEMGHLFELSFARSEWVRKLQNVGDGSLVVFVERLQSRSQLHFIELDNFEISSCSSNIECPDANSPRSLFDEGMAWNFNEYYQTTISPSVAIRFLTGWCTNDQSLLYQNLEHIEFVFNIDGVSYTDYLKSQYRSQPNGDDATQSDFCYLEGAVVKNWRYGAYDIQFGFRIDAEIFDGWETYPAQDLIRYFIFDVQ